MKEMRKAGRLKNLKVREVSLVDLAANNRDFIILKSMDESLDKTNHSLTHDEDKLMSFLKKLKKERAFEGTSDERVKGDHKKDEKETRKEVTSDAESADANSVEEEKRSMHKSGDEVLRKVYQLLASYLLDEDNEAGAEDEELEEVLDNEDSRSTLLMNKRKDENMNPELHKLLKSQSDILKAQHAELNKAKTEIKLLKEEADERKQQTFIDKAKSLKVLGADDKFGLVLKSLAEKSPDEYEKVLTMLSKAADSISKADYLDEIGSGFNRDNQNSVAIVQENANVIQKEKGLTKEQAIAKALEQDPSLYDAYLKERKHGI